MKILLDNIGKRYNKQWIFKNLTYTFEAGQQYAILGKNGSGKSTLLQCIIGSITCTNGTITYYQKSQAVNAHKAFQYISLATPYIELIEEFTTLEMLEFHQKFKSFSSSISFDAILEKVALQNAKHKPIQNFSSGMKQRLKLALAFFSNTSILCLDEPTANLDAEGIAIYEDLISNHLASRTLIVASNEEKEYSFCKQQLHIADFQQ